MQKFQHKYMVRCLDLAYKAVGFTSPNPMVGAVLVYNEKIIGEGYHKHYGSQHAEVNCIDSVPEEYTSFIPESTLYVSLEPCAHFGKTPPCTDLIIRHKIPHVVIGCRDPFELVNGKGIDKLKEAGVKVELVTAELQQKCIEINRRFFCYHQSKRPYIILKWAQTSNGFMGYDNGEKNQSRLLISNEITNRFVHKWRSEEAAIMIGTNAAMKDDPILNNRYWPGPSPIRIVLDMELRLPNTLKIFNDNATTIIFNGLKHEMSQKKIDELRSARNVFYYKLDEKKSLVRQVCEALYKLNILSVLVEGGSTLLNSFISENLWDEARIITGKEILVEKGLKAPVLNSEFMTSKAEILNDSVQIFKNLAS